MKKVYVAGPQVFFKNADDFFGCIEVVCRLEKLQPLIPLNKSLKTALDIFEYNMRLLDQADCVIASVDCFRGAEPDSGTCFEIGYAHAKKIPIYAYTLDTRTTFEKAADYFIKINEEPDGVIENFGRKLNLMLALSCEVIEGTYVDAIFAASKQFGRRSELS